MLCQKIFRYGYRKPVLLIDLQQIYRNYGTHPQYPE